MVSPHAARWEHSISISCQVVNPESSRRNVDCQAVMYALRKISYAKLKTCLA